jgi:hypothetical protein
MLAVDFAHQVAAQTLACITICRSHKLALEPFTVDFLAS